MSLTPADVWNLVDGGATAREIRLYAGMVRPTAAEIHEQEAINAALDMAQSDRRAQA